MVPLCKKMLPCGDLGYSLNYVYHRKTAAFSGSFNIYAQKPVLPLPSSSEFTTFSISHLLVECLGSMYGSGIIRTP